jgi:predicted Zn-dependent protease
MDEQKAEQMGSLEEATRNAAQLLDLNPVLAAEQAEAILEAIPNHPPAMFLLASALRRQGEPQAAVEIVEPLLDAQHKWAAAWFEYGVALGMLKRGDEAVSALLRAVDYQPEHPEAWRYLADHLMATGDTEGGDLAYTRHILCSTRDPQLQDAAAAMVNKEIGIAERLLKRYLARNPTDVAAIRMLAEVAIRCERNAEAKNLLQRCLELSPGFLAARANLAL